MENIETMRGEIVLNMSAEKAWEVLTNNDKLSKVDPQMLSSAEYIEGDGSPGTLRLFKLGPGTKFFYILLNMHSVCTDLYYLCFQSSNS